MHVTPVFGLIKELLCAVSVVPSVWEKGYSDDTQT